MENLVIRGSEWTAISEDVWVWDSFTLELKGLMFCLYYGDSLHLLARGLSVAGCFSNLEDLKQDIEDIL